MVENQGIWKARPGISYDIGGAWLGAGRMWEGVIGFLKVSCFHFSGSGIMKIIFFPK